jgi:hypothetical protein
MDKKNKKTPNKKNNDEFGIQLPQTADELLAILEEWKPMPTSELDRQPRSTKRPTGRDRMRPSG